MVLIKCNNTYVFIIFVAYFMIMSYLYYEAVWYGKAGFQESFINNRGFLIDTPGYQLPDYNPFDRSVIGFLEPVPEKFDCSVNKRPLTTGLSNFTYGRSPKFHSVLVFHQKYLIDYSVSNTSCCYSAIHQITTVPNYPDSKFRLGLCVRLDQEITKITDQSVIVSCVTSNITIYRNAHVFVHLEDANQELDHQFETKARGSDDPISLLILGLDSVSRINMQRYMKKTLASIATFDYIDLKGYNKVKENTFPNNIILLTGKEKVKWSNPMFFDHVPFVWSEFSERGFSTAFAEDCTALGLFHTHGSKRGFKKKPTDYYLLPSYLAIEETIGWKGPLVWIGGCNGCLGPIPSIDSLLQYALDLSQILKDKPHFSFIWSSSLTHDRLQFTGLADDKFTNVLTQASEGNYWNHTIVLLLSDHGIRFGNIRKTFIGQMEENLPFGYFLLPKWFKKKYPLAYENLAFNQQRLVTQYDLHQTISDIAHSRYKDTNYMSQKYDSNNLSTNLSLFRKIPGTRTCAEAHIPVHYCSGIRAVEISKDDSKAFAASKFVVDTLNEGLLKYPQCFQLTDFKVNKAYVIHLFNDVQEQFILPNVTFLEVQITTYPGDADLESVVRMHKHLDPSRPEETYLYNYTVQGTVSRLNSYAGQSDCIFDSRLVKYCFCKDLLT